MRPITTRTGGSARGPRGNMRCTTPVCRCRRNWRPGALGAFAVQRSITRASPITSSLPIWRCNEVRKSPPFGAELSRERDPSGLFIMFRRSPVLVPFGLAEEQTPMGMKTDRDLMELARGNFNAEQIAAKLKLTPKTVIKTARRLGVYFPPLELKRNGRRPMKRE